MSKMLIAELNEISEIISKLKYEVDEQNQVVVDAANLDPQILGYGPSTWLITQDEENRYLWHTHGSGVSGSLGELIWSIATTYTARKMI